MCLLAASGFQQPRPSCEANTYCTVSSARVHWYYLLQVTENGVPVPGESEKPLQEALRDTFRLAYYRGYIEGVCKAVAEDGVNLTGYYAWSLMDNFE